MIQANEILHDLVKTNESDWWDELPQEIQEKIDKSIADSEDESNLISKEEVIKKYKFWLK